MPSMIEINKLGKRYSLSAAQRYLALRDVLSGYFRKKQKQLEESLWALKDIDLDVEAGEKIKFPGGGTHFHHGADKYISNIANVSLLP